jgi:hypothetical protein
LNDPLIWNQFQVSPDDMAFEKRERAADFTIDLGWPAREFGELLGV